MFILHPLMGYFYFYLSFIYLFSMVFNFLFLKNSVYNLIFHVLQSFLKFAYHFIFGNFFMVQKTFFSGNKYEGIWEKLSVHVYTWSEFFFLKKKNIYIYIYIYEKIYTQNIKDRWILYFLVTVTTCFSFKEKKISPQTFQG
jgi:hypothetical protein